MMLLTSHSEPIDAMRLDALSYNVPMLFQVRELLIRKAFECQTSCCEYILDVFNHKLEKANLPYPKLPEPPNPPYRMQPPAPYHGVTVEDTVLCADEFGPSECYYFDATMGFPFRTTCGGWQKQAVNILSTVKRREIGAFIPDVPSSPNSQMGVVKILNPGKYISLPQ